MPAITDETTRFIDVSKWQKPQTLHWRNLPSDVVAVVARATYGIKKDPHFLDHFDATVDANRMPGAYHFVTYAEPSEQWDAFRGQLAAAAYGDDLDLLPVLDLEWLPGEKSPRDPAKLCAIADDLIGRCYSEFGGSIIYTATGFWQQCGYPSSWLDCPLWLAHYPGDRSERGARAFAKCVATPRGPGNWQMWQAGPRDIPGFCSTKIDYNYSSGALPVIDRSAHT